MVVLQAGGVDVVGEVDEEEVVEMEEQGEVMVDLVTTTRPPNNVVVEIEIQICEIANQSES